MRGMVLALIVVFAAIAHADDKPRALDLYRRATQHFDIGEYQEALAAFKEAYRSSPDPALLYDIAQCHRQLGDLTAAVRDYRIYLVKLPDAPNRDQVRALIEQLDARAKSAATSTTLAVVLDPAPADATVLIDGVVLAPTVAQAPRRTSIGPHDVRVVAVGYRDFSWKGAVNGGESKTLVVKLVARRAPQVPRWLIYTTGATGVAALAGAIVLASQAKALSSNEQAQDPYARNPAAPDQIRALSASANGLFISGGALLAGSGASLLANYLFRLREHHEAMLFPWATRAGVGVGLRAEF